MTSLPSSSAAPAVARLTAAAGAAGRDAEAEAEAYERTHVHGVYQAIAPHFSATRHKPWPAVASFLHAQPPGSVGLDVGCGNGKYLGVNPSVVMLGSDRSPALVALARSRRGRPDDAAATHGVTRTRGEATPTSHANDDDDARPAANAAAGTSRPALGNGRGGAAISDVLVADGLSLPFRDCAADFAICVAVVHHLSTRARRRDAIRQLLRCVKTGEAATGQVLVYVWALEQGSSRRGWDEGGEQDLLVPWVLKNQNQARVRKKGSGPSQSQKSSRDDAAVANKSGEPPVPESPAGEGADTATGGVSHHTDPVFERYYHLYRKGELEEDVLAVGGVVIASGYERDNWWAVAANEAPPSPAL